LLSPNLKSFLNINHDNQSKGQMDSTADNSNANLSLSPTHSQLGEDSTDDDEGSTGLLHSIFSPKFHAKSAKKKLRSIQEQQQQQQYDEVGDGGGYHSSIFSPESTASSARGDDANSAVSEMSDDFGTINAILRGDTIENIKRHVGLDRAHHPLSNAGSGKSSDPKAFPKVDLVVNTASAPSEEDIVDDSTADMLDKARALATNFTSPSSGNSRHHATTHAKKTPKVTPTSEDEFYTPTSSVKPQKPARHTPMALNFDIGGISAKKGLPPVWEEEEIKTINAAAALGGRHGGWDPYQKMNIGVEEDESLDSIKMSDFRTPKEHDGMYWKMDDFNDTYNEDDEEEFFSPLVQHAVHTPSSKHHNESDSSNHSLLDFKTGSNIMLVNSFEQLSVSQSVVPCTDIPIAAAAPAKAPIKRQPLSSPKYSEVTQELQSLLTEAKGEPSPFVSNPASITTPPPRSTPLSLKYPHTAGSTTPQSPSFHLHTPSMSRLPPDALTVDFVMHCDCIDTLKAILCLLSDDNNTSHRNNAKSRGNKQSRYPSLVRLVDKRLQKMQTEMQQFAEGKEEEQPTRIALAGQKGVDKENVDPEPLLHQKERPSLEEIAHETYRPMESITVLHDSKEDSVDNNDGSANNAAAGSPAFTLGSATISHSSLDMNLSQSLFALDDESFFWKAGMYTDGDVGKKEKGEEQQPSLMAEKEMVANQSSQHKASQTEEEARHDDIHQRCAELKNKLASTLTSNARLTGEVDSLVNKHNYAEYELSSKLQHVTDQLSHLKVDSTAEKDARQKHICQLETINHDLLEEVRRLHEQLHQFDENAGGTTRQLQSELEEARMHHSTLSQDKEMLGQELNEMHSRYDRAQREVAKLKLLLDKKNTTTESESVQKLHRTVESTKLANQALANALAVSEMDLAEAIEAKGKSVHECNTLRDHTTKLEDKTFFLSSKVKEMNKELESSNAYIDQLYTDLQTKKSTSPSKEMKSDFERRELEWMELERGYSKRIQELEGQVGASEDSQHVSMDAYMKVAKQTRHYKLESMKNVQTIEELKATVGDLREQLDVKQRSSMKIGGGKSLRALQNIVKDVVPQGNDENAAPSNPREQQHSVSDHDLGLKQLQRGKQLNRVAAVKAAGGRKGLSEQLKRSRRFGEKM